MRFEEDLLKTSFDYVIKRRHQDEYIRLSHKSSEDVFKTSWLRPIYSSWAFVFKTSSRRLQDVFKTSSISLLKTSSKHLQDICNTSCKGICKTYSTHIIKVLFISEVKSSWYHQVKLLFLTCLREVCNTFLRHTPKTVIYRGICLCHTTSEKFIVSAQNLQERKKILKFQFFSLLHLIVAAYRGVFRIQLNIYNGVLFV